MADNTRAYIPDRGPTVLAVTCAVSALSTLFVLLRGISRIVIVRHIGSDDYWMFVAWLFATGLSVAIMVGTTKGLGRHDDDILSEWAYSLKRSQYAFSVFYNPALMASKTSILMFYIHLTKSHAFFRRASVVCLVVVNAAGFALTLLNIFQCHPVGNTFSNPLPAATKCTDIVTLYLSSAPVNILSDLAILFLPMPILTALCLPQKQKIILVATFGLGGFVTIVDIIRVAYLQEASLARLLSLSGNSSSTDSSHVLWQHDFAWYASLSFMWSAVEVNVGIICACIPTLKPLVSRVFPGFSSSGSMSRITSANAVSGLASGIAATRSVQKVQPEQNFRPSSQRRLTSSTESLTSGPEEIPLRSTGFAPATGNNNSGQLAQTSPQAFEAVTESRITSRKRPQTMVFSFNGRPDPKSLVKLTNRESARPFLVVTVLFFLWGFAYGLLGALNGEFQTAVGMSSGQRVALHCVYFAGYFTSPITFSYRLLEKFGFKITFITGLCIYSTGSLVFWPSAVLASFPAFLVSNFIVALGLSTLEIAANPFIALCGPPEHAEARLNFAQAVQAIGGVLSPLLATLVLFKQVDVRSLIDTQWTYLAISLFVAILAGFFYYYPLPEVSTDDLEEAWGSHHTYENSQGSILGMSIPFTIMIIGAIAQFGFVGGQETVSPVFSTLWSQWKENSTSTQIDYFEAIAHGLVVVGRISAAIASYFLNIKPRFILLFFGTGAFITSTLTTAIKNDSALITLMLISFFQSAIFPTIFVISIRGQGRRVKLSSAFQIVSIVSGAFAPAIQYAIEKSNSTQYSLGIAAACYGLSLALPIYTTLSSSAKLLVDPVYGGRENSPANSISRGRLSRTEDGEMGCVVELEDKSQTGIIVERHVHIESHPA